MIVVVWDSDDPAKRDDADYHWTRTEVESLQDVRPGVSALLGRPKGWTLAQLRARADEQATVVLESGTAVAVKTEFSLVPYEGVDPERTRFLVDFSHGDWQAPGMPATTAAKLNFALMSYVDGDRARERLLVDTDPSAGVWPDELASRRDALAEAFDDGDWDRIAAAQYRFLKAVNGYTAEGASYVWRELPWDPDWIVRLQGCVRLADGVIQPAVYVDDQRPGKRRDGQARGRCWAVITVFDRDDPRIVNDRRFWFTGEQVAAAHEHDPDAADLSGRLRGESLAALRERADDNDTVEFVYPEAGRFTVRLSLEPYRDADPDRTWFLVEMKDAETERRWCPGSRRPPLHPSLQQAQQTIDDAQTDGDHEKLAAARERYRILADGFRLLGPKTPVWHPNNLVSVQEFCVLESGIRQPAIYIDDQRTLQGASGHVQWDTLFARPDQEHLIVVVWDRTDPNRKDDPRYHWTEAELDAQNGDPRAAGDPKGWPLSELRRFAFDNDEIIWRERDGAPDFKFSLAPYRDADPDTTLFINLFSSGVCEWAGPTSTDVQAARRAIVTARAAGDPNERAAVEQRYATLLDASPYNGSFIPWNPLNAVETSPGVFVDDQLPAASATRA